MGLPKLNQEYAHLKELQTRWGITYGPVQSRRLGLSLGINLSGKEKACSFDCGYCELGPSHLRMNQIKDSYSYPSIEEVRAQVSSGLRKCLEDQAALESLTLSGNGEPTLHPQFLECVQAIVSTRDELAPGLKIVALTNGAHCDNKRVVHALNQLDERMVKLDAGNERVFKSVNRPLIRGSVTKVTNGARRLKDVIIQSLFVTGAIDNTRSDDIEEWIELVGIIRPKCVHIMTLDRIPAMAGLKKADEDTLYTIASKIRRKLQIETSVFS